MPGKEGLRVPPEGIPEGAYATVDSAFAGYLLFRKCRLLGVRTQNGHREVTFLIDLLGQDIQVLEGEYWQSEAYQVENLKKLLIKRYVKR